MMRLGLTLGVLRTARALQQLSARPGARALAAASGEGERKRVIFLGSPGVAALTLGRLLDADANFDVVAAVSQPPAPKGRKRVLQPCEVQALAEDRGLLCLTPAKAKDPDFLAELAALRPDVCVTAAYGQFLPKAFLAIPALGTLNIHPSLLPRWRGAAPVQRSLEAGDARVGVTVLQTVLKMDAGPIAARSAPRTVEEGDTAATLLDELFGEGCDLLIDDVFPKLFDGSLEFVDQSSEITEAPKLTKDEGFLDVLGASSDSRSVAAVCRDKVRAFSPWPGTFLNVRVGDSAYRLKVLEARVGAAADGVSLRDGALAVPCADGSALDVLRVQPPNKKGMDAGAYCNGLRGAELVCVPLPEA